MQAVMPKRFTARKDASLQRRPESSRALGHSQQSAAPCIESLEQRLCFATVGATLQGIYTGLVPWLIPHHGGTSVGSGSDRISSAKSLGSIGDDRTASGTLGPATDVN